MQLSLKGNDTGSCTQWMVRSTFRKHGLCALFPNGIWNGAQKHYLWKQTEKISWSSKGCTYESLPETMFKNWELCVETKAKAKAKCVATSYACRVPRTGNLPSVSFRRHLAMITLALELTVSVIMVRRGLHLQVSMPAVRTMEKAYPI